jgi:hypothetical protein
MKKPREVLQPRWAVFRLGGKRAERTPFTVTARDAEEARERAIKENETRSASAGGSASSERREVESQVCYARENVRDDHGNCGDHSRDSQPEY